MPVPPKCQEILGKKEITRSLKTGDPVETKRIYAKILAEVQEIIASAQRQVQKTDPPPLRTEKALKLVREHFQEIVYEHQEDAHSAVEKRKAGDSDCAGATRSNLASYVYSVG